MTKDYVLGLDVGTTTIRCYLYNRKGEVCGSCSEKVSKLNPKPEWDEIDPDDLWQKVIKVITGVLSETQVPISQICSLGISCQRATFTNWSKSTGRHYHNFVTYKDMRADKLVKEWNRANSLGALRLGGKILHCITRLPRFLAASMYTLYNSTVTLRLLWVLDNVPGLRSAVDKGDVMFGCVDSWLIYKFTGKHMTEISNIAATAIFDPFTQEYADWIWKLFNIPGSIFPPIVDSCGEHFGSTLPEILGSSVPIRAVLADQSASVFGSGCYEPGSAKITLGTGSYLDVPIKTPHASMSGLFPVIGWRLNKEVIHLVEGQVHDIGVLLEWAKSIDLFNSFSELGGIVDSVRDSGGVYFVPGFHGLPSPISDPSASAGFIGVGLKTTKPQMLRAIVESIAYSQKQLVDAFLSESSYKIGRLVVDGGVANSNFILQLIADLTGLTVERPVSVEMSVWGAASLAGLESGLWSSREELVSLNPPGTSFIPNTDNSRQFTDYRRWQTACQRFTKWTDISHF